jgi:pimeloyl-ACP methyl ester carboxylesterase
VIAALPEVGRWVIAGHSLGAAMACRFVYKHPDAVSGLLLWDGYPPDTDDLTGLRIPVRQIYRSGADGTAPEAYRKTDHLMPAQTERIAIAGASHLNYGRFIAAQRFATMPADITQASIPIEEQHARIVAASLQFLQRVANAGGTADVNEQH